MSIVLQLNRYLSVRRSLGYDLRTDERILRRFARFADQECAMADPTWLMHCQRILAMPNKRYVRRTVTFLDAAEIAALWAAPDRTT
jgi:hypothetical protein